ncbi:site-2 protease family protein [Candidatus Parcubacteria bacterium]|nr:site-2 protease family protein [Candidatus Parcubacteria bacterium]
MFLTIIVFLIVLSLLVFVHEMGHFWVARRFGLRPKEFGFGMPPRAFGIYKDKDGKWKKTRGSKEVKDAGDTIYSVNWLPLGGFVSLGEDDEATDDPNHFHNKPAWQRTLILLAGVSMNVLLAAVLISFGLMIGLPQTIGETDNAAKVTDRKIQIIEVLPDSIAFEAGIKANDIILSLDGGNFSNSAELQNYVDANVDNEIVYDIKRGQKELEFKLTPRIREDTKQGGIGIAIVDTGIVRYPFFQAIWNGIKITLFLTWYIIFAFYELIKGLVIGQGLSVELGGPVRIAQITGDAARMGLPYLINFSALLSINLAIINALPFPALDGGRILFIILEKIMGRPVKKELEGTIHYIGFIILMILILLVTYKDVIRLFQ